jgi:hypothetical protein
VLAGRRGCAGAYISVRGGRARSFRRFGRADSTWLRQDFVAGVCSCGQRTAGYLRVLNPEIELPFAPVEVLLRQMDYVVVVFLSAPGRVGNRGVRGTREMSTAHRRKICVLVSSSQGQSPDLYHRAARLNGKWQRFPPPRPVIGHTSQPLADIVEPTDRGMDFFPGSHTKPERV